MATGDDRPSDAVHENPKAVVDALMAIIHQGMDGDAAWDIYNHG
jgi:fructose-bisphosphate aldolase, class I